MGILDGIGLFAQLGYALADVFLEVFLHRNFVEGAGEVACNGVAVGGTAEVDGVGVATNSAVEGAAIEDEFTLHLIFVIDVEFHGNSVARSQLVFVGGDSVAAVTQSMQ